LEKRARRKFKKTRNTNRDEVEKHDRPKRAKKVFFPLKCTRLQRVLRERKSKIFYFFLPPTLSLSRFLFFYSIRYVRDEDYYCCCSHPFLPKLSFPLTTSKRGYKEERFTDKKEG
jgi:hypothetical protein